MKKGKVIASQSVRSSLVAWWAPAWARRILLMGAVRTIAIVITLALAACGGDARPPRPDTLSTAPDTTSTAPALDITGSWETTEHPTLYIVWHFAPDGTYYADMSTGESSAGEWGCTIGDDPITSDRGHPACAFADGYFSYYEGNWYYETPGGNLMIAVDRL